MAEEVVSLSIEETNALRAELGLKPLQISKPNSDTNTHTTTSSSAGTASNSEELTLSINESNNLRAKLGLKPLKTTATLSSTSNEAPGGRKSSEAIHAPPVNTAKEDLIKERIAQSKLKREVEAGIAKFKQELTTTTEDGEPETETADALSWADRMRAQKDKPKVVVPKKRGEADARGDYTDSEFQNQNLTVAHNTSDFETGTTTVLTLADRDILDAEEDNENALENVNMSESATVKDNLKQKRMVEMGMGHAGGYAGYDDDEFEELGGSQMVLGMDSKSKAKGKGGRDSQGDGEKKKTGFKLGGEIVEEKDEEKGSDLFATLSGKSVSLVSGRNDSLHQADFMSYEEEEAMGISAMGKDELAKMRKKKEKKVLKKLKKDKKKKSRKHDRENEDEAVAEAEAEQVKVDAVAEAGDGGSLLDALAASSQHDTKKQKRRKRRREVDSDDSDDETTHKLTSQGKMVEAEPDVEMKDEDETMQQKRKDKFHSIMEKGNQRTQAIFGGTSQSKLKEEQGHFAAIEEPEEDDDAFLSVALSKARRLTRLRELNAKPSKDAGTSGSTDNRIKGATNAVVEALQSMKEQSGNGHALDNDRSSEGKITFELGATTEFTRALRAQPTKPESAHATNTDLVLKESAVTLTSNDQTTATMEVDAKIEVEDVSMEEADDDADGNRQTLEELADQVDEESENLGALGSTASAVGVGRGMSAFLGMLKHTGEISGKSAGREELRGRAKDEKTYDDYAPLNLKEVVQVDTSGLKGRPHDKDVELANREIKLEYRDDHGRLLTRKEAYRQLCYQFHGHGSSKKNEEKRLQQIKREQVERSANTGTAGTFGALKATQKATGKAFVLHKT